MTGVVQYAGRTFEYNYEDPTDDEVESRALEIQRESGCSIESARGAARSELVDDKRESTKQQALSLLQANLKSLEDVKAEVGISQRLKTDPGQLKAVTAGLVDKELTKSPKIIGDTTNTDSNADKRIITDEEVEDGARDLVSFLNHRLYEKRQKRLDAIARKGGSGSSDADFRVDIEIETPSTPNSPATGNPIGPKLHEIAMRVGGAGALDMQYAQAMKYIDRYDKTFLPASRELTGYTFITRPHCNFASENLANVREFAPLLYAPSSSIGMAIRGYLDTELYRNKDFSTYLDSCPFYDPKNAFLVPIVNALRSITGFPDINLGIETTEGGFFSEQQTSVTGYDRLAKGQELSLTFRDFVGSPILAMHEYWANYMGRLGDGTMHQYPTDLEANLMGYTCSIYRFVMDPTNRYITRWAKATGCFPKLAPSGAVFNVNENEKIVQAVNNLSVQYFSHHIAYNDPLILKEFNILVERYAGPEIATVDGNQIVADGIINNHLCLIPYISQRKGMNELQWRLPSGNGREGSIVQADYQYAMKAYNEFSGLKNNVGPLSIPN